MVLLRGSFVWLGKLDWLIGAVVVVLGLGVNGGNLACNTAGG